VIAAPDVDLSYSYDGSLPLGTTWTGAINASVSRTFDSDFRIVNESVNGGSTVGFTYDNDGLVTGASGFTLTRDPQNGLLTGTTLGSVADSWTYNSFGEPIGYEATASGSSFYSATYTRDKLGRITDKSETVSGATDAYHYTYDDAWARKPPGWLIIQPAKILDSEADLVTLGRGERAAITLALEHKPDVLLIIDESKGVLRQNVVRFGSSGRGACSTSQPPAV